MVRIHRDKPSAVQPTKPMRPNSFLRSLIVPAGAITVVAALVMMIGQPLPAHRNKTPIMRRADGKQLMPLVAKDAHYKIVPPARNTATGTVWFSPSGNRLSLEIRASNLAPRRHYVAEAVVDGDVYPFARVTADSFGGIALDTTLVRFSSDACVRGKVARPQPLKGGHDVKFWIRRDGAPAGAGPCSGNGDGDDRTVLYEQMTERFVGD